MSTDTTTAFYAEHGAGPEWGTPVWVVEPLETAVDGFDLDPAAGAEPRDYARERFTGPPDGADGLARDWFGRVWLNPPYGRRHNPRWAAKVTREVEAGRVRSVTALVPASTSTDWWHDHYGDADAVTFLDTRLSFVGSGDTSASFASCLASFGSFPAEYWRALDDLGRTFRASGGAGRWSE
jgi:phage N-6-adenine-methyltransferase